MVPLAIIATTLLIHLTWGYNEELYPLSDNLQLEASYLYPEEYQDENDFEIHRRNNNNFLRFGRSGRTIYDTEYDDSNNDFTRPTRSGKPEKNDHFIRFGRSRQDFLRFGRDRSPNYLRFGRSIHQNEGTTRRKRDTYSDFKRGGSNFMRFGRNSNFLRFGRNNEITATADPRLQESPLIQLLTELVENMKKEINKNSRNV